MEFLLEMVLLVIALRVLKVMDKIDEILENVEDKVNSFNGAFTVIKSAADGIASISDSFVYGATSLISKLFGKFNKKNGYKEDEDYEG